MFQEFFKQRWVQEVMGDLVRRQPKSNAQVAELKKVSITNAIFWPFQGLQMPLCLDRAEGGRVWDVDGNEYVDIHLGFGTQTLHGHNPEPVVKFVREHLGKTVGNSYFNSIELEHARQLKELMPHNEKFAFLNSGGDATNGAIRLARAFTGKRLVVRFEGTVQGSHELGTFNSIALYHGQPLNPFPPKDGDGIQLTTYAKGVTNITNQDLMILSVMDPQVMEIIARRKDEIACVIVEPVPGGFPFAEKTIPFMKELGEVCRKSGVLFILDEVHTGFRFNGISGAAGKHGIYTDMCTYGKVLSGLGLPMSAIGGRAEILDLAQTSGQSMTDWGKKTFFGSTHSGNHIAMLASYATIAHLKEKGPAYYERTEKKVQVLRDRLKELHQQGVPLHLVGSGSFIGGLVVMDERKPLNNFRDFSLALNPIASIMLSLMLRRAGLNTYAFPYFFTGDAHTDADIQFIGDKLIEVGLEMKRNNFPFVLPG